jgi:hypothetical protein
MEYSLTIQRYRNQFPPDSAGRALSILQRYVPEFFPARMAIGHDKWVEIPDAGAFDPSSIPQEYWIQPGRAVRVPIDSVGGSWLEIENYHEPGLAPCYLGLHWCEDQLPSTNVLCDLLSVLGQSLHADRGRVTDEITLTQPEILDRLHRSNEAIPEALYWLNWFSAQAVAVLGRARFDKLAGTALVEERDGGLLVALQDTPFRGDDPEHGARRIAAEQRFGLSQLL